MQKPSAVAQEFLDPDTMRDVAAFISGNPMKLLQIPEIAAIVSDRRAQRLLRSGLRQMPEAVAAIPEAVEHNARQILARQATLRPWILIRPLLGLDAVRRRLGALKVLSVGPRTEEEIIALLGSGFAAENITAVDLITYSPWISLADMHDLPFADEGFDIVLAGWVLSYSQQPEKAAAEMWRVLRPGGHLAIGCQYVPEEMEENRARGGTDERLYKSPQDIVALFGAANLEVVFQSDVAPQDRASRGDIVVVLRRPT
ncbi:hypothetical protein JCM17960_19770 [Magnetospira thiophila]